MYKRLTLIFSPCMITSIVAALLWTSQPALADREGRNLCDMSKQDDRQCRQMMTYDTRGKVKSEYEKKNTNYCNDIIFGQDQCRRAFVKLIDRGCVSERYVAHVLFSGSVDKYNSTPREQRNYDYYPLCGDDAVITFCKCGCFDKSVNILAESKEDQTREWTPIPEFISNKNKYRLLSLEDFLNHNSAPKIKAHESFGTLVGNNLIKTMVTISTAGGRSIRLTDDHPLLTEGNRIILAKDVKTGTILFTHTGDTDTVSSVSMKKERVNIYNVETPASVDTTSEHLIFANELIVGDLALQQSHLSEQANIDARTEQVD